MKNKDFFDELRKLIEENFPKRSKEEREEIFQTLKNHDYKGEEIEIYSPTFHGVVLRVGIQVKGTTKHEYYDTDECIELQMLLKE